MKNDRTNGRKTIAFCLAVFLMVLLIVPPATAGNEIPLGESPISQEYLVKGDPLAISGTVPGLSEIRMWLFGPQYAEVTILPVLANGSFSYSLSAEEIREMESGDYYVVLQSSGENNVYDIPLDERTGEVINRSMPYSDPDRVLFTLDQAKNMREAAPDALVRAIKVTAGDDGYAVYTFSIADPFIELDPVRDTYVGETITISGRTNVPAGEELLIVFRRGFKDYGEPGDLVWDGHRSVTIEVGPASVNHFSADFNSSATKPGQHWVLVSSFLSWESDVYTTFTLLEAPPPTTVPSMTEQVETTVSPTDTATTATTPPTTAPLPGIISLIALTVGFGVLAGRRN